MRQISRQMDGAVRTSAAALRGRKRTPAAVAAAAVFGLIWLLSGRRTDAPVLPPAQESARTIGVTTESEALSSSTQQLEAPGTVHSELEAAISSRVMARIKSVLVREGDSVRSGQPLVLLDSRDLDASVAQASANVRAASAGYDNARAAARMEAALSAARISEARSKIAQSEAAARASGARLDLVRAGPRPQERAQAALEVAAAQSNLTLAQTNLRRMQALYTDGAIAAQQYDQYRSQYEVARSQFQITQQAKSIADEGSRSAEIAAALQSARQADAAVQEARSGLRSAQASAMQTEVRRQEVKGAEAQIGQTRAGLLLASVARDYAVITAPFAGTVTKRMADPGAMAGAGTPLLTLQGGTQRLEAVVPESLLGTVKLGSRVPVRLDALPNRPLTGHVVEIAPQGDASSHSFLVKVALPAGSRASAGMFGRALFATGAERQLLVPVSALVEREGLRYLYVVDASHIAHLRMVTVGEAVEGRVPVLSGLNAGEHVVTAGTGEIGDGSRVTEGPR